MLLASSMLVACGGNSSSATGSSASTTPAVSSAKEEVKAVYEIKASYDELYDQFAAFEFWGLMNNDGNGTLYRAMVQNSSMGGENGNKPQVEENPVSFKYKVTSDEGIDTLEASIGGTKFTGYKNTDGDFVLKNYSFPFAGGYSRSTDLIVSTTIEYKTVAEWTAGVTEEYKDRKVTVKLTDLYKGAVVYADGEDAGQPYMISFGESGTFPAEAKFECYNDFSLKVVWGVGGYGGASYEGTWTVGEDKLHHLTFNNTELVGVEDGDKEKFTWTFTKEVEGGDPINLKAELSWTDPNAQTQAQ